MSCRTRQSRWLREALPLRRYLTSSSTDAQRCFVAAFSAAIPSLRLQTTTPPAAPKAHAVGGSFGPAATEASAGSTAKGAGTPMERRLSDCGVMFSVGRSNEFDPNVAAAEAFDLATAALPKAPNFCMMNVSVDCPGMENGLPAVWGMLTRAQALQRGVDPATTAPHVAVRSIITPQANSNDSVASKNSTTANKDAQGGGGVLLLGSVVRDQRFNGTAFTEVMLGHIPDLQCSVFTLDAIPPSLMMPNAVEVAENKQPTSKKSKKATTVVPPPPPMVCALVWIDWRLSIHHIKEVNIKLDELSQRLREWAVETGSTGPLPVVVGGVFPPAEINRQARMTAMLDNQQQEQQQTGDKKSVTTPPPPPPPNPSGMLQSDSMFCVNDSVFRGSACVTVLHSNLITADVMTEAPLNFLPDASGPISVTAATLDEESMTWTIDTLNGKPATDVVKELYEGPFLKPRLQSRLFFAVSMAAAAGGKEEDATTKKSPTEMLSLVALPFKGLVTVGSIVISLPPAVYEKLLSVPKSQWCVYPVIDNHQWDGPAIAEGLVAYEQEKLTKEVASVKSSEGAVKSHEVYPLVAETQRIVAHREKVHKALGANACLLHWFHPGLYETLAAGEGTKAQEQMFVNTEGNSVKDVPSVASRVLGSLLPVAGVCVSGQVGPFIRIPADAEADTPSEERPMVGTRSSIHVVLRERKL